MTRALLLVVTLLAGVAHAVAPYDPSPDHAYGWSPVNAGDTGPGGDFVDLFNGAAWLVSGDVVVPGPRGLDVVVTRSYSSQRARVDRLLDDRAGHGNNTNWLGRGWRMGLGGLRVKNIDWHNVHDCPFDGMFDAWFTTDFVSGEWMISNALVSEPDNLPDADPAWGTCRALGQDGSWLYPATDDRMAVLTRDGLLYLFDQRVETPGPLMTTWYPTTIRNRFGDEINVTYLYPAPGSHNEQDFYLPYDAIASIETATGDLITFDSSNDRLSSVTYPGGTGAETRLYNVVDETVSDAMVWFGLNNITVPAASCDASVSDQGLPATSPFTFPVLESATGPGGLVESYTYDIYELYGRDAHHRAPSPDYFTDVSDPGFVPMHFALLSRIEQPTGLVTELTYEPETYLADGAWGACGEADLFEYLSRLAVVSRTVTVGGDDLLWEFERPVSLVSTLELPNSCYYLSEGIQYRVAADQPDEFRSSTVVDPWGGRTTSTFYQEPASYFFGSYDANLEYCVGPDYFVPTTLFNHSTRHGLLLSVERADASETVFETQEWSWVPWTPWIGAVYNYDPGSYRPLSMEHHVDGNLVRSWDVISGYDVWGRAGQILSTWATPDGGMESSLATTTYLEPAGALKDWNLLELPNTEQVRLDAGNGPWVRDASWTWGTAGGNLGRPTALALQRHGGAAGALNTSWAWSNANHDVQVTETRGSSVTTRVYGPGGLASVSRGNQPVVAIERDGLGRPTEVTDTSGDVIDYTWDDAGRLDTTTLNGLQLESRDYALWPEQVMTNTVQGTETLHMDELGRVTQHSRPINDSSAGPGSPTHAVVAFEYDDLGKEVTAHQPAGTPMGAGAVTLAWDERGRLSSASGGTAGSWSVGYDLGGLTGAFTKSNSEVVSFERAADGSLRGLYSTEGGCLELDPTPYLTEVDDWGGEQLGLRATVSECAGSPTAAVIANDKIAVDATGQVGAAEATGRPPQAFDRDAAGRVSSVSRPGSDVSVSRDSLGRLTSASRGAESVTLGWGDELETVTSSTGTTTFTHDEMGGIASVETHLSLASPAYDWLPGPVTFDYDVHYSFDERGRVTEVEYPSGALAEYTWHDAGGLDTATFRDETGTPHPVVTGTWYSPFGGVSRRQFVSGVTEQTTLDEHGRTVGWGLSGVPDRGPCDPWNPDGPGTTAPCDPPPPLEGEAPTEEIPDPEDESFPSSARSTVDIQRTYAYDDQDRLVTRLDSTGPSMTYAWGADGMLESAVTGDGTSWEYEWANGIALAAATEVAPEDVWQGPPGPVPGAVRDLLDGAGWVADEDEGAMTVIAGGALIAVLDAHGRPVELRTPEGVTEAYYVYGPTGRLALEFVPELVDPDDPTIVTRVARGRHLVWGRDGRPLAEERFNGTDWELYRELMWDPHTGDLLYENMRPESAHTAPLKITSAAVSGTTEGTFIEWDPVPQADYYVLYRDGQAEPYRFIERTQPFFRDYAAGDGLEHTYEVTAVSASGEESAPLSLGPFANPHPVAASISWNLPPGPIERIHVTGCAAEDYDPTAPPLFRCAQESLLSPAHGLPPTTTTFDFDPSGIASTPGGFIVRVHTSDANMLGPSEPLYAKEMFGGAASPDGLSDRIPPGGVVRLEVHTSADGESVYLTEAEVGSDGFFGVTDYAPLGLPGSDGFGPADINPRTREMPAFVEGVMIAAQGLRAFEGTDIGAHIADFYRSPQGRLSLWLDEQAERLAPKGFAKLFLLPGMDPAMGLSMAAGLLRTGVGSGAFIDCSQDPDCVLTEGQLWALSLHAAGDVVEVAGLFGGLAGATGKKAAADAVDEGLGGALSLVDDVVDGARASPGGARWTRTNTPWQRRVHQRSDIAWDAIRPDGVPFAGKTNRYAARKGYAPGRRNPDTGKWDDVVLHHLNQDARGSVMEVFRSKHGKVPHKMGPQAQWRKDRPDWARAWSNEQSAYWRWRSGAYNPAPTDLLRLPGDL